MLLDRFYRGVLRPVLFRADAEWVHDHALRVAERVASMPAACRAISGLCQRRYPRLSVELRGLRFPHPLGLAAGFDKSGRAVPLWAALGFGHVEIGSISAHASQGNPKPRLFRLPGENGIIVNYGLPNDGAALVASRLAAVRLAVPLGINIVNTNRGPEAPCDPEESIVADYTESIRRLQPCADYLVLNLSCPNTPEGRGFVSDTCRLRRLLDAVEALNLTQPLFLKVAPFSTHRALELFLETVDRYRFVSGFAVNLPPGKPASLKLTEDQARRMPGAVAGKPAEPAINRAVADFYSRMDRSRHRLIAAGGVFSARDAYTKIRLGASLVQVLTALVFRGPGVVREICEGLEDLLERDGFGSIAEAVGADCVPAP